MLWMCPVVAWFGVSETARMIQGSGPFVICNGVDLLGYWVVIANRSLCVTVCVGS